MANFMAQANLIVHILLHKGIKVFNLVIAIVIGIITFLDKWLCYFCALKLIKITGWKIIV